MAISATLLTSGTDPVNNNAFTTASVSPGADKLILLIAGGFENDASLTGDATISGNGLTWVAITAVNFNGGGPSDTNFRRLVLYRAMGTSPSSGAITITWPQTIGACSWHVVEVSGIDTSGTNGSGAIVQSATNSNNDEPETATSLTVTLAAFASASNGALSCFSTTASEAITHDPGWTELADTAGTSPNSSLESQWRADNDTTAASSWTTAAKVGGIAIEIKVAGAVPVVAARHDLLLLGVGA